MKNVAIFILTGISTVIFSHFSQAQIVPEGKCLNLNGVDQHLSIPNHPDLNITAGESFTLTCRIMPVDFDTRYSIISKGNLLVPGSRYELATIHSESTPNLALNMRNSENTDLSAPNLVSLSPYQWVHFAWVYNSSEKSSKVYVNGILITTVYNPSIGKTAVANAYDLTVGCTWTDASEPVLTHFWPGQIDELRIWKRALPVEEVAADQTAAKPASSGLVAAYDFENMTDNMVPDISGKGHNGQLFGYGIQVVATLLPVGAGEPNERLAGIRVTSVNPTPAIRNITLDLSGTTDISDVTTVKVYYNGTSERLNLNTAVLFGSVSPSRIKTIVPGNIRLAAGDNYFWVTADISPYAREGHVVLSKILSYSTGDRETVSVPESQGSRTILLASKLLFSCGDAGSKNYRIPAIVTAKDGSLVTATDKRWNGPHDLPDHIDVVMRRSTDNGQTWSSPQSIAGEGTNMGFGDPALVVNERNGDIICLFAVDKGFYNSTSAAPIRIYQSKSTNNGITWSVPADITTQIYGLQSANALTQGWQGAFVTSGRATQLRNGRILAVMPVRETTTRTVSNFVMYSDDNARTWKVSPNRASTIGNEGKIVELEGGKLLMSIRNNGNRMFNISKDQGMSWGIPYAQTSITDPSCNGDMIRYTSFTDGYNRNRLLHSIPYAGSRKNVSVLLSYDEGITWPIRKTIYSGASAYSSLCILNDGTIGIYYEVGEYETYQMYFVRFSLDWLSGGTDTWTEKWRNLINSAPEVADNRPGFTVYPNPASGFVNIAGQFDNKTPVEIFDSKGALMSSTPVEVPEGPVRISLPDFPPGVYFLKAGRETVKFAVK